MDSETIVFAPVGFEGPTAPAGKVNTLIRGDQSILLYTDSDVEAEEAYSLLPHEGIYAVTKNADMFCYEDSVFSKIFFGDIEHFLPW